MFNKILLITHRKFNVFMIIDFNSIFISIFKIRTNIKLVKRVFDTNLVKFILS